MMSLSSESIRGSLNHCGNSVPAKSPRDFIKGCYEELKNHCESALSSKPQFVLNGTGKLNFIFIFKNDCKQDASRHWHYVGLGLSDITGYSQFRRLHEEFREKNAKYRENTEPLPEVFPSETLGTKLNGFGFELTLRIKCNSDSEWNSDPPVWPQALLQDLAGYVYQTRNIFNVNDHVAWDRPLDGGSSQPIKHLFMTRDLELDRAETSLGPVEFIQIVGACQEELEAAQKWSVDGILGMMMERPESGGRLLVTDMTRVLTIFNLDPGNEEKLDEAIEKKGSDLVMISDVHKTSYRKPDWYPDQETIDSQEKFMELEDQRTNTFKAEVRECEPDECLDRPPSRMSLGSESALRVENDEFMNTIFYKRMYIQLSERSARILPVMLRGRLKHNRDFSFQSPTGDSLITFVPDKDQRQSLVGPQLPFARRGSWLQIFVPEELRKQMYESIKADFDKQPYKSPTFPLKYSWPEFELYMRIEKEIK